MKKRKPPQRRKRVKRKEPTKRKKKAAQRRKFTRKPVRKSRKVQRRKGRTKPVIKRRAHKRSPKRKPSRKARLKQKIRRDKVRVFGTRRKRRAKEMPKDIVQPDISQVAFEDQLADEQKKPEGAFPWTDETSFIEQMQLMGFSEREAYTLWFS